MKQPEARIQAEIVAYLQTRGIFCHSVWNEGGGENMIRTAQAITTGLRPGVGDLVVWFPFGPWYIEVKTRTGVQSKKQKAFEKLCKWYGFLPYRLVRSVEDVQAILEEFKVKDGEYGRFQDNIV